MKARDILWALTGFGVAVLFFYVGPQNGPRAASESPAEGLRGVSLAQPQVSNWDRLVERAIQTVQPSVVNINTIYRSHEGFGFFQFLDQPREGLGSGVIFDRKGFILTNNHVVKEAERILVSLLDGRRFVATLVGRDPETDIAVLQVPEEALPTAKLGDSSLISKGQWVVAIGNPFGLESTATIGIVSALGRDLPGEDAEGLQDLIQTDAAINPGNSGGALADLYGAVIGINTAVIQPGVGQGIGFAIPINTAYEIARILIEYGKVSRPWIGVIPGEAGIDADLASQYSLPLRVVFVDDMYRGSPAAEAGLLPADILLSVDGKALGSKKDLRDYVRSRRPGDLIRLEIFRLGKRYIRQVRLGEKPLDIAGV